MARRSNGEGTAAQQRKNGTWYRAVRIEGTNQRKFIYGKTKAEVDKKYKEFIKQVAGGTYTEVKKQSVEAYLFDWLTTYKKIELKPKSYDRLECTIKYQVAHYFKGYGRPHTISFVKALFCVLGQSAKRCAAQVLSMREHCCIRDVPHLPYEG